MHTYATRTLKGNISKTNKRDVRLVSFIITVSLERKDYRKFEKSYFRNQQCEERLLAKRCKLKTYRASFVKSTKKKH